MSQASSEPRRPVLDAAAASSVAAAAPAGAVDEVVFSFGDRRYRVRGLARNHAFDVLKVNLLVSRGDAFHVDTFDLYSARHRSAFVQLAAKELGVEHLVVKKDLGAVLIELEARQEQQIQATLEPQRPVVELSDEERAEAMALLEDEHLLEHILTDFEACGVVGEETNKLIAYLAATSRKLKKPLAVMIQSSSAAGKSSLMEAVLSFIPDEEKAAYSAMTGQSLFYMGEADLKHKVLAIAEEEGADQASYALKLLQSEGRLKIASTGKDPQTGRHATHEYEIEGPVAILSTTTAIDVDEELLNRCLVLTVDEGQAQTRAIHERQRKLETLDGLTKSRRREHLLRLHQNAQRLLRPIEVVNPFAEQLTFLDHQTRSRRDHQKYLTIIRTLALLHQHQRPVQTVTVDDERIEYIEVTPADIAMANRLAHQVLGRSLDELPPQTKRLLAHLFDLVAQRAGTDGVERSDVRFSRRDVRVFTGWGDTQLKVHLGRLVDLELVIVHRGERGRSFVYELLWDGEGQDGSPFVPGLVDPAKLGGGYDFQRSGSGEKRSAPGRGSVGGQSAVGRGSADEESPRQSDASTHPMLKSVSKARSLALENGTSHRSVAGVA